MKLAVARLCLDCEEVHDAQQCPVCASESFAFISRWVPVPEGRTRSGAGAARSEDAANGRRATTEAVSSNKGRLLTRSVVGVAAVGIAGWLWQWSKRQRAASPPMQEDHGDPSNAGHG